MSFEMNNIGRNIGNYRIIAEIGSGGFARVYLGEHLLLKERVVAIKFLHTYLRSPEEYDRFLLEARMLEQLRHHHILLIYDVGIDQGYPYLVAEYAPHGSLRDRIKRAAPHPLPTEEVVRILSQIAQALQFAHQQHIIHRDLKPENILFNRDDEALLADFGIATTLASASFQSAKLTGTPSYMAPEQFAGNICRESDQYALGCIGYELLTGSPPFAAENVFATGFKHLHETPPAPAQLNPGIPSYIEQAILTAMAKDRSQRYPDFRAFISALHGATDRLTPTTQTFSPPSYSPSAPTLAASSPQHALQEPGQETTRTLPQQDRSDNLLFTTPPAPLQDPFPAARRNPVTLPPLSQVEPFSAQNWMPQSVPGGISQRTKRSNKRRWLIGGIACIVALASILSALLFVAFPGSSRGSNSLALGTQTAVIGSGSSFLSATASRPGTPNSRQSKTAVSILPGTPTPMPTSSPGNSPTLTPTAKPTATFTPTPTHTPITETLTVNFFSNSNGTQTQHSYQGSVTLSISGYGQASSTAYSDAFYQFTNRSGTTLNPPVHPENPSCWVLYINGEDASTVINGGLPSYYSNHTYTVTMNAPGGTINFKVCDNYYLDNTGSYTITVTQN